MKKVRFLSLLLFFIALNCGVTSCGDDDDEKAQGASIVGAWNKLSTRKYLYFNSDNTGYEQIKKDDGQFVWKENWTYNYNRDQGSLLIIYDDGDIDAFTVSYINQTEMEIIDERGDAEKYLRVNSEISEDSDDEDNWNSGSDGGGSSSAEAPSFYDFSYTCTETSVSVIFATDPKATRATIYYGNSSPTKSVTTTISGRMISARITGLTKGTKYYVKCVASNSYGSTTSDVVSVRTDYY